MFDDRIFIGATKRFEIQARKDGLVWDFTSAAVTMYLKHPNGSITSHAGTVDTPATAGIAYFVAATTTLDVAGLWQRWWIIVDSTISEPVGPFPFQVHDIRKC